MTKKTRITNLSRIEILSSWRKRENRTAHCTMLPNILFLYTRCDYSCDSVSKCALTLWRCHVELVEEYRQTIAPVSLMLQQQKKKRGVKVYRANKLSYSYSIWIILYQYLQYYDSRAILGIWMTLNHTRILELKKMKGVKAKLKIKMKYVCGEYFSSAK